jgi:hypothetical protein
MRVTRQMMLLPCLHIRVYTDADGLLVCHALQLASGQVPACDEV